jgi:RNA polymerase sigma factor (TIGR02999 family)
LTGSDPATRTQRLLAGLRQEEQGADDELVPLVYAELHAVAEHLMRGERRDHTLQATALVNEVWLRMAPSPEDLGASASEQRASFLRIAARAMRNALVDHARRRRIRKPAGGDVQPLDETLAAYERETDVDVVALHEALDRLGVRDPELVRLVELRHFAGLTLEQAAAALDVTVAKVRWSWDLARGWLRRELGRGGVGDG